MAYLPETEEKTAMGEAAETKEDEEVREAYDMEPPDSEKVSGNKRKKKEGSFGRGFVTGVAATLICMFVFTVGWQAAQIRALRNQDSSEQEKLGAEVLTDGNTLYKLNELQAIVEEYYYDEVDAELLTAGLFKGIAAGLGDLYADYYSVQELQSVMDSSAGEYHGIGTTLSENVETGEIVVMEVYEDGPAEQAGLQVGDRILSVMDQDASMGLSDLVTLIKGSEGEFQMKIYREKTGEELELTMECGEITVTHVKFEMKENRTGYIRISEFTSNAVDQFKEAVEELNAAGMEKLIVDLRNNPGGLLDSVCDILDYVIPEGLIVYTEDKNGNREEYKSKGNTLIDCEVAVLVNGYSASASEIFAGAVQDYELGPIIGTQTYGKGVVQKTYPLSDGSAFKLTVEKYFTPKGQDIDGNGITPDVIVDEEALEEAELQTETEAETTEQESESEADLVLEKALEILHG